MSMSQTYRTDFQGNAGSDGAAVTEAPIPTPTVRGHKSKKSAGAFRTISEVAQILDVQQHVLRFWETKFSQVKPLKRGGGRRYYRPEDVAMLQKIHDLLYTEGYTIKGVQKLLKEHGKAILTQDHEALSAVAANESAVTSGFAATPSSSQGMSSKQKQLLQGLLGDLKDLRDVFAGK